MGLFSLLNLEGVDFASCGGGAFHRNLIHLPHDSFKLLPLTEYLWIFSPPPLGTATMALIGDTCHRDGNVGQRYDDGAWFECPSYYP